MFRFKNKEGCFSTRRPTFVAGLVFVVALLSMGSTVFSQVELSDDDNYVLAPGDVISIQVFGQGDLSAEQEISNAGEINLGLIGQVSVAQLSLQNAEKAIRDAFVDQQFLRDPQVIIRVIEYASKLVSVLGQVNRPGSIQMPKDTDSLSLARVISMVGDFSGIAKRDDIRVVRKGPNGKEQRFSVDMSGIGKNKRSRGEDIDFMIYPDDVIYVPERLF